MVGCSLHRGQIAPSRAVGCPLHRGYWPMVGWYPDTEDRLPPVVLLVAPASWLLANGGLVPRYRGQVAPSRAVGGVFLGENGSLMNYIADN